jgi:type II secretory pathway pseudopilin PulG
MTMVELLTVVVVLGTLMAIAVPAFFHHRDKARDASAQASARAAQTAAIEIGQENEGRYSGPEGVTPDNLRAAEPTLQTAALTVPVAQPESFTVRVQSETGNTFDVRQNDDGTVDLVCASADDAGCPSDGTWD